MTQCVETERVLSSGCSGGSGKKLSNARGDSTTEGDVVACGMRFSVFFAYSQGQVALLGVHLLFRYPPSVWAVWSSKRSRKKSLVAVI